MINITVSYLLPQILLGYSESFTREASDATDHPGQDQADSVTTTIIVGATGPTARGDAYATPIGKTLNVAASRVSGVLYNDFGGTGNLTAELVSSPTQGTLTLNADGSFTYDSTAPVIDGDGVGLDSFTYQARDAAGEVSAVTRL